MRTLGEQLERAWFLRGSAEAKSRMYERHAERLACIVTALQETQTRQRLEARLASLGIETTVACKGGFYTWFIYVANSENASIELLADSDGMLWRGNISYENLCIGGGLALTLSDDELRKALA